MQGNLVNSELTLRHAFRVPSTDGCVSVLVGAHSSYIVRYVYLLRRCSHKRSHQALHTLVRNVTNAKGAGMAG